MSQENVDVVIRFEQSMVPSLELEDADAATAGFEKILALLDAEVVFRPPMSLPHGGDWTGHDGFVEMGQVFNGAWEMIEPPKFDFMDAGGDRVVLIAHFIIKSRETGTHVPVDMVEIVTVRDGKIVELVPYYRDTVPLSQAAGLTPAV
jgi:ketosteroid isomerase-like protein